MDSALPATLYFAADPLVREQFEQAFSYSLRLGNGTLRYTYPHRLDDVNQRIDSLLPDRRPLRILDVAISCGITTLEWVTHLERAGVAFHVTASDMLLTGHLITVGRGLAVLTDDLGIPLQYMVGGRVLSHPPGRSNTARYCLPLTVLWWARHAALSRARRPIAAGIVRRLSDAVVRSREVDFVMPRLRDHPNVEVVQDDLMAALDSPEQYHVIRAANILNRCYFSDAELQNAIRSLAQRLHRNGLLIICSTTHEGLNNGTAFVRSSRQKLEIVSRINNGSDMEQLADVRIPGDPNW